MKIPILLATIVLIAPSVHADENGVDTRRLGDPNPPNCPNSVWYGGLWCQCDYDDGSCSHKNNGDIWCRDECPDELQYRNCEENVCRDGQLYDICTCRPGAACTNDWNCPDKKRDGQKPAKCSDGKAWFDVGSCEVEYRNCEENVCRDGQLYDICTCRPGDACTNDWNCPDKKRDGQKPAKCSDGKAWFDVGSCEVEYRNCEENVCRDGQLYDICTCRPGAACSNDWSCPDKKRDGQKPAKCSDGKAWFDVGSCDGGGGRGWCSGEPKELVCRGDEAYKVNVKDRSKCGKKNEWDSAWIVQSWRMKQNDYLCKQQVYCHEYWAWDADGDECRYEKCCYNKPCQDGGKYKDGSKKKLYCKDDNGGWDCGQVKVQEGYEWCWYKKCTKPGRDTTFEFLYCDGIIKDDNDGNCCGCCKDTCEHEDSKKYFKKCVKKNCKRECENAAEDYYNDERRYKKFAMNNCNVYNK